LRMKNNGFAFINDIALTDSSIVCTGIAAIDPMSAIFRANVGAMTLDRMLQVKWSAGQHGVREGHGRDLSLTDDGFMITGLVKTEPAFGSDVLLQRMTARGLLPEEEKARMRLKR
jgi:hypothetical protein